jgi:tetratricopeptide (TPR) repeat protein
MIGTTDGESYTVRTKYISDALKLEEELIRENRMLEDTYHFWYIGKSYMDAFMGDFYPLGKSHSDEFARRALFYFTEYIKHIFGDNPPSIHEMVYFTKVCIGQIHKYFGEYDLAINQFKEAENYCQVRNEHIIELTKIYSELEKWDDMLEQTKKLISPERKIPFPDYYFLLDTNIYIDSNNNYVNELHQLALSKTPKKEKNNNMININQKKRIFVVDDFYSDPYSVRDLALKEEFNADLNWYKGKRTNNQIIFPGTKEAFEKIIGQPIKNWSETHGMCGRFQSCTSQDPLVYHWDGQQWAGMVYLTPDAPYVGGTSLFAHKETKVRHEDDEGSEVAFNGGFYDRSKFELVDTVGNVFNRLVIFDARSIHGANEYFGNSLETSRLFHMFFFD